MSDRPVALADVLHSCRGLCGAFPIRQLSSASSTSAQLQLLTQLVLSAHPQLFGEGTPAQRSRWHEDLLWALTVVKSRSWDFTGAYWCRPLLSILVYSTDGLLSEPLPMLGRSWVAVREMGDAARGHAHLLWLPGENPPPSSTPHPTALAVPFCFHSQIRMELVLGACSLLWTV
jgi:hypothetical protein